MRVSSDPVEFQFSLPICNDTCTCSFPFSGAVASWGGMAVIISIPANGWMWFEYLYFIEPTRY